jgi:PAS domain-containing protein
LRPPRYLENMPDHTPNHGAAGHQFHSVEQPTVTGLLERISELEDENANLRRLEEAIQRNTHLFEALLRASREGILLLSPALTVLRVIRSSVGHAEKDLLGQSLLTFLHPDDAGRFEQACAGVLSGSAKTCPVECRALGPGDQWIWLEFQMTDMLDDPNVHAIVLNVRRLSRASE